MTIILGIKLSDKVDNAVKFQEILTKFNCIIKLRIGINNSLLFCSDSGIILLQIDKEEDSIAIEKELINISGIEIQKMVF